VNKTIRLIFMLLLSGHLLAACGEGSRAPAALSFEDALDAVNDAGIRAHFEYLADDALEGRMTGEPGYDMAASYVAEQFAAMGLEPGGDGGGWYQQVPLVSYRSVPGSEAVVLHRGNESLPFVYRDEFAMGGDRIRDVSEVRAEVVYVGYGVHAPEYGYSDYEGVDVEGKIVALFGDAPPIFETTQRAYFASFDHKGPAAVRRGAVGVIGLSSRRDEANYPWDKYKERVGARPGMAWATESGDASSHYPELVVGAALSVPAATTLFETAPFDFETVRDALETGKPVSFDLGVEVSMRRESVHERLESPNVIGVVRGTDPELADEYVVYTAHLDHDGVQDKGDEDGIYNGAYDNAMGVALMLETARVFAAAPPRRSVLFVALTGEERGLLGSDYFAHYPTVPAASIVANVNLDMPLFLYPVADLVAFGSQHSSLGHVVDAAAKSEGFVFSPDPMPEENLFVRSDQYSLVKEGVPAVFLFPGFTSTNGDIDGEAAFMDHMQNHYHHPSDDLARPVDWPSAVRFARAHIRIGHNIATEDSRPRWNEGNFFGEMFASPD